MNRDGFQKMMGLVRQGKVSKVIVYKLDRISRSLSDFMNILQEFKEHKVEFVSSQEAFDTSSPYGDLIVKILMVFAEFERTSIINRVSQPTSIAARWASTWGTQALRLPTGAYGHPQR